jgi:PIN domain nuclease of toxin-antitoxin system
MPRALLDTEALYLSWLGSLTAFPHTAQAILLDSDSDLFISSVSLLEIAVKHTIGKILMDESETRKAIQDLRLKVLRFDAPHALRMFSLPLHHRDPFDRAILATALVEDLPVISGDRVFRLYKGVETIW